MEKIITEEDAIRERLADIPYNERVVLIADCLRSNGCGIKKQQYGLYECENCYQERDDNIVCPVPDMIEAARKLDYKDVYVISGQSGLNRLLQKEGVPKAVLGVACPAELEEGIDRMKEAGIEAQVFSLLKDGCAETSPFKDNNNIKNEWFEILTKYPPSRV